MSKVRGRTAALIAASILAAAPLSAARSGEQKLAAARDVYLDLMASRDSAAPTSLAENAECIAVFPSVIKGALGWSGQHGKGVISCRTPQGEWSPPAFLKMTGGGFGLQVGGEATDLVLFFMNRRGARSLLESKFTLGADASVAAGPVGRDAHAATDLKLRAEILSYAKSRGLFIGVALEGSRVAPNLDAIREYYGERLWADQVLFDQDVPSVPASAKAFTDVLP